MRWTVTGDNEDLLIFKIEIAAQNSHNLVIDAGGKSERQISGSPLKIKRVVRVLADFYLWLSLLIA